MKISFYQRSNSICVRISHEGKMRRIHTGIHISEYDIFNNRKQLFMGNSSRIDRLNKELKLVKESIRDLLLKFDDVDQSADLFVMARDQKEDASPDVDGYVLQDLCQKYVAAITSGKMLTRSNRKFSAKTCTSYASYVRMFTDFGAMFGTIDISRYHVSPHMSVEEKRSVTKEFSDYFNRFVDYMTKFDYSVNTRAVALNVIGVITKHWEREFYFTLPKFPKLNMEEGAIIVLPSEAVQEFFSRKEVYEGFDDTLKTVWEVCAVMLITTLRIEDALSLSEEAIIVDRGNLFIRKRNEKTRSYTNMPLPPMLSTIFSNNLSKYRRLYTATPEAWIIYRNIRKVFYMYEPMQVLTTVTKIDSLGNEFTETKPWFELVHPHMLRKTAITMMLANGVSREHAKFASGHAPRSVSFDRYVGFVDSLYKNEVTNYFSSIGL